MSDLVKELRDYVAFDPRTAIIAVDPLPDGYCIIPRTSVLLAADEIVGFRDQLASEKTSHGRCFQLAVYHQERADTAEARLASAMVTLDDVPGETVLDRIMRIVEWHHALTADLCAKNDRLASARKALEEIAPELAELGRLVADSNVSPAAIGMRLRNTWPLWERFALSDEKGNS